jgi:hypothetical protein
MATYSPQLFFNVSRSLRGDGFFVVVLILVCGCQSLQVSPASASSTKPISSQQITDATTTHNNALDLLHDLLGDEKNLSKVLIIKHASPELKTLVKRISGVSAEGVKTLEMLAKTGGAPQWGRLDLPAGERATREAISKDKEHELLHSSGNEFEFQLLLSQAEGLNYGAHLAKIASVTAANPGHAAKLSVLGRQLEELRADVLSLLRLRNG